MLVVDNISFSYEASIVIDAINLSIANGNHVALIGESGSGKSTLLKLLYGIYDLDSGQLSYNGSPILGPKHQLIPGDDRIKYLAQDFDLMPFITAAENVGKFLSNSNKKKKQERISELLEMVGMSAYANVKAQYLSGGEQQRIALAKVIASEPEVLLLDEPFSQIDSFRANSLKRNLFRYLKQREITCLFATHDGNDVLSFADHVVIMRNGKIIEQGNPKSIYEHPQSIYIGSLFGEANEIPVRYIDESKSDKSLIVYPHQLTVVDRSTLAVTVINSYFKGKHYLIESIGEGGKYLFEHPEQLQNGRQVYLQFNNNIKTSF